MTFRQTDGPAVAAAKASISTATAYRYEHSHQLPSSQKQTRGRRRPDPLADFFDTEVVPMLKAAPDLRAVAIFRRDAAAPSGLVDRGTSYARAPYPAVNAAILVIDDARAVIDGREQHQRRFAAAGLMSKCQSSLERLAWKRTAATGRTTRAWSRPEARRTRSTA